MIDYRFSGRRDMPELSMNLKTFHDTRKTIVFADSNRCEPYTCAQVCTSAHTHTHTPNGECNDFMLLELLSRTLHLRALNHS